MNNTDYGYHIHSMIIRNIRNIRGNSIPCKTAARQSYYSVSQIVAPWNFLRYFHLW